MWLVFKLQQNQGQPLLQKALTTQKQLTLLAVPNKSNASEHSLYCIVQQTDNKHGMEENHVTQKFQSVVVAPNQLVPVVSSESRSMLLTIMNKIFLYWLLSFRTEHRHGCSYLPMDQPGTHFTSRHCQFGVGQALGHNSAE